MKKTFINIVLILMLLIGISLLLYPRVSNFYITINQKKIIDSYNRNLTILTEEKYTSIKDLARKYNNELYKKSIGENSNLEEYDYEKLLTIEDSNVMGYLNIPKINVDLPIYHGVNEEYLTTGVGHFERSSLNIGGNNTNTVLFGHTGYTKAKLLNDLDKLKIGDEAKIFVLGDSLNYKVVETKVILPDEIYDDIIIKENKDLLTLVTCTPYGINTHRLVVICERVIEETKEDFNNIDARNFLDIDKEKKIVFNNIFKKTLSDVVVIVISIALLFTILIILAEKERKSKGESRIEKKRASKKR